MASLIADPTAQRATLQQDLHAATREVHMNLNRSIMARLPLCLPPHTSGPYLYTQGMTVFANIYHAFETTWQILLSETQDLNPRHREMLEALQTDHLARTSRLENDLATLSQRLSPSESQDLFALRTASQSFSSRIQSSISAHPHHLLAYTWTMYHALFNGGRWIHKQLDSAGPTFWLETDTTDDPTTILSFWTFDAPAEEIKTLFKSHFATAESLLTDEERSHVVEESKRLFQMCIDMVDFLDVQRQNTTVEMVSGSAAPCPSASVGRGAWWQSMASVAARYLAPVTPRILRKEIGGEQ